MFQRTILSAALAAVAGTVSADAVTPPEPQNLETLTRWLRSGAAVKPLEWFPEERALRQSMDAVPSRGRADVGAVTWINARQGLVWLTIGRDDGVKEGDEFDLYRDGKFLIRVVVRETTARTAAARLLPETRRGEIELGDAVRRPR